MTNRLIWFLATLTIALLPLQSRAEGAAAISEAPMKTTSVVNTSMAGAVPTTTATAANPTGLSTNQLVVPQVVAVPSTDDSHSQNANGISSLLMFLSALGSVPGGSALGQGAATLATSPRAATATSPDAIYGTQTDTNTDTNSNGSSIANFFRALFGGGSNSTAASAGGSTGSAGAVSNSVAPASVQTNPNGPQCSRESTVPGIVYGPGNGMSCGDVLVDCGSHKISFSNVPISSSDQTIDCGKNNTTHNGLGKIGGHHSGSVIKDGVEIDMAHMGARGGGKVFHTTWWNPGCKPTGINGSHGCVRVDANVLALLKKCQGATLRIINANGGGANPSVNYGSGNGNTSSAR